MVLAIDIREPKGAVEKAVRERGYPLPVLLDNTTEVTLMYEVRATPTVYLVDRRRKRVASAVGAHAWESPQRRKVLQELLAVK